MATWSSAVKRVKQCHCCLCQSRPLLVWQWRLCGGCAPTCGWTQCHRLPCTHQRTGCEAPVPWPVHGPSPRGVDEHHGNENVSVNNGPVGNEYMNGQQIHIPWWWPTSMTKIQRCQQQLNHKLLIFVHCLQKVLPQQPEVPRKGASATNLTLDTVRQSRISQTMVLGILHIRRIKFHYMGTQWVFNCKTDKCLMYLKNLALKCQPIYFSVDFFDMDGLINQYIIWCFVGKKIPNKDLSWLKSEKKFTPGYIWIS